MLRPTKHSHPDRTLVGVAYVLLAFLKKRRIAEFREVRELAKKSSKGTDALLLPAVNLLFMIGVLEYRAKIDSFEYVGK
jgi:hypothetical protein